MREEDTDSDIQLVLPDGRVRVAMFDLLRRVGWEIMHLGSDDQADLPTYTMGPVRPTAVVVTTPQDEMADQG